MKNHCLPVFGTFITLLFFSCGNNTGKQETIDSLRTALVQQKADYKELDDYISIISLSLDSIAVQENVIFKYTKDRPLSNPEKIKQELSDFQSMLRSQRNRINRLEQELKDNRNSSRKLKAIVVSLKAQITEKEYQISKLNEELSSNKVTIGELNERMNALIQKTNFQEAVISSQSKMIQAQDDSINTGFVKIATKSELKELGLLEKKFLSKSKINYSMVDKRQFNAIDIRLVTEIEVDSKKPKILSPMPEESYVFEPAGDKTILRITDTEKFWRATKMLIIQM